MRRSGDSAPCVHSVTGMDASAYTYELTLTGRGAAQTAGWPFSDRAKAVHSALAIARSGVREGRCRPVVLARIEQGRRREIAAFQPADRPEPLHGTGETFELYNPRHPEELISRHEDLTEAALAAAALSQDQGPDRPICVRIVGRTGAILSFRAIGAPARAAA